jgi:phosphate transport system protein
MVTGALAAYKTIDAETARAVAARDNEIDAREKEVIKDVLAMIRDNGQKADVGAALLWAVHNYERVADRATNIAERVVFIATGQTPDLD